MEIRQEVMSLASNVPLVQGEKTFFSKNVLQHGGTSSNKNNTLYGAQIL